MIIEIHCFRVEKNAVKTELNQMGRVPGGMSISTVKILLLPFSCLTGATPLTGGLLLPFINDGCNGNDDSSSADTTFDADTTSLLLLSGGGLLLTKAS
jgi:hypothetical protein